MRCGVLKKSLKFDSEKGYESCKTTLYHFGTLLYTILFVFAALSELPAFLVKEGGFNSGNIF